jgi:hypothetical protein
LIVPVARRSWRSIAAMKNPDRVRNMSMPSQPPVNCSGIIW